MHGIDGVRRGWRGVPCAPPLGGVPPRKVRQPTPRIRVGWGGDGAPPCRLHHAPHRHRLALRGMGRGVPQQGGEGQGRGGRLPPVSCKPHRGAVGIRAGGSGHVGIGCTQAGSRQGIPHLQQVVGVCLPVHVNEEASATPPLRDIGDGLSDGVCVGSPGSLSRGEALCRLRLGPVGIQAAAVHQVGNDHWPAPSHRFQSSCHEVPHSAGEGVPQGASGAVGGVHTMPTACRAP